MKEDTTPIDPTWMQQTGGYARDMTLRDYFAAKAMAALLPTYQIPDVFEEETRQEGIPTTKDAYVIPTTLELITKDAYVTADAMLEERNA